MRTSWIGSLALAAVLGGSPSHAQSQEDVPRTADGKPDFTGIYTPPAAVNGTGPRGDLIFNAHNMAPVKPGAESLLYVPRTGDTRIDDPKIFERPWSQDFELTLRPDWEQLGLIEYACEAHNRCAGGDCSEDSPP